jgi:pilus assembly protein CpaB
MIKLNNAGLNYLAGVQRVHELVDTAHAQNIGGRHRFDRRGEQRQVPVGIWAARLISNRAATTVRTVRVHVEGVLRRHRTQLQQVCWTLGSVAAAVGAIAIIDMAINHRDAEIKFLQHLIAKVVSGPPSKTVMAETEILTATAPLAAGTLLREQDVAWQPIGASEPGQIIQLGTAAESGDDQQARDIVNGAALRRPVVAGGPIRRGDIVNPGDQDFLKIVLSPGARAIAVPITNAEASTGLLSPGDRVDVVLTQKFTDTGARITRRSVSETVVESLRVLAIDPPEAVKGPAAGNSFGRTVTLEVMPDQAERINVAAELGKLSLTTSPNGVATASTRPARATGIKPTWAGDVSPALGGAMPPATAIVTERRPGGVGKPD